VKIHRDVITKKQSYEIYKPDVFSFADLYLGVKNASLRLRDTV